MYETGINGNLQTLCDMYWGSLFTKYSHPTKAYSVFGKCHLLIQN